MCRCLAGHDFKSQIFEFPGISIFSISLYECVYVIEHHKLAWIGPDFYFIHCFYLLTILGEIYYSRWSIRIASLSLFVYLSHVFLATCKKQDVTFIYVERRTR